MVKFAESGCRNDFYFIISTFLANDILERKISLAILSEVWEKKGNKKHKFQIEKMLQEEGLKYISTPQSSSKRGGGCAIVAYLPYFSLEKLR